MKETASSSSQDPLSKEREFFQKRFFFFSALKVFLFPQAVMDPDLMKG